MSVLNIKSLVHKLNPACQEALEAALGLCVSQTHYSVEIEHWLLKLLEKNDADFIDILKENDIEPTKLQQDLVRSIEKLKRGNTQTPTISQWVIDLACEAWLLTSLEFGFSMVNGPALLAALIVSANLRQVSELMSPEFAKLSPDALKVQVAKYKKASDSPTSNTAPAVQPGGDVLDQFTVNLNQQAESGKIDAVIGRDSEIRQMIDILSRRRQNNPILTGEPGVGKTAVVEGLALKIVQGDVPDHLKNITIRSLDMGLLQAGAGVKGEFENRLKNVIQAVQSSPTPIVLFIDEAHTMIGAGGQEGQSDAANLLKPALARGELKTIAATTWAEYKKYFEKDAALTRRFQVVSIEEPDDASAIQMLRAVAEKLATHHGVIILDEAVVAATQLSKRYIPNRQLPDKSISVLDTVCAKVASSQTTTPALIADSIAKREQLQRECDSLIHEQHSGFDHAEQIEILEKDLKNLAENHRVLEDRWHKERDLLNQIKTTHENLDQLKDDDSDHDNDQGESLKQDLKKLRQDLSIIQEDAPLLSAYVDAGAVGEVIASWTGIPVGRMVKDQTQSILHLDRALKNRVIGQDHALEQIAETIKISRAKINDPNKPVGVFLLLGPSGTGKTETALALADELFGGESHLTVINMSEFKEAHKVSTLTGSPPGYVGFGEGGVLTEAVRRKPYSLVLLDEMEKSHPSVQELFYQVFDKGILRDSEGRNINFKNTVILMTANVASEAIADAFDLDPDISTKDLMAKVEPELLKVFKPAFLGRISPIPYKMLSDEVMQSILDLKLRKISDRLSQQYKASFNISDSVKAEILGRCHQAGLGARQIDAVIQQEVLPKIAEAILAANVSETDFSVVEIDWQNDEFSCELK